MIVNSAYVYYGKMEPAPVPELFADGVSNYDTDFSTGVQLDADGLHFKANDIAKFKNIPLSKFTQLTLRGSGTFDVAISPPSGGAVYGRQSISLTTSKPSAIYTIPEKYRIDGYGIRFANGSRTAILKSAILS